MKKSSALFQTLTLDQKLLLVITISAIISLSLFEVVYFCFFLYFLYLFFNRKIRVSFDLLGLSLLLYLIPILVNNILYVSNNIWKALDRIVAIIPYFYRFKFDSNDFEKVIDYLYSFYKILTILGLILIPVVIFQYHRIGEMAIFWGGKFKAGFFYSLFFLSSLALYLYSRKSLYLYFSIVFLLIIFFSTRRSVLLGLLITLLIILFQCRSYLKIGKPKLLLISIISIILSFIITSGLFFYLSGVYFPQHQVAFELLTGKRDFDLDTLDKISASRLRNAIAGLEVMKKDLSEANIRNILFGHGMFPGERLNPKPYEGLHYESILVISEYIENGLIGLLIKAVIYYKLFKFILSLKLNVRANFLFIPLYSMISIYLIFSIFTLTWDVLLPLYLLFFRFVENAYQAGFFQRERHIS